MSNQRPPRIAIVAGEASGDLLGSHLIQAIKAHCPNAEFYGIAGAKMVFAGARSLYPMEKLSVNGYVEVIKHLPELLKIRRNLKKTILANPPDLFIGIDAPDFNLGLEASLKSHGIPTVHYVSPSIWAWRGGRIKKIAKAVSHMLVVFPFEAVIYQKAGIPVTYVGHPLADTLPAQPDRDGTRARLNLPIAQPIIALLPGSRVGELKQHAQLFVETAQLIQARNPQVRFITPLISRATREIFTAAMHACEHLPNIQIMIGHADYALAAADIALIASGTATLEAALLRRPMVITYRVPKITAYLMRRQAYLPWVGLPNILANREVVPELVQENATAPQLADALMALLEDKTRRAEIETEFTRQYVSLKQNTAEKMAAAILPYLKCD
ncbi:lipid-A-disaccharide synthase [Sulfuriferula nivalis]|uniref:Lipid-A-disaccharide synthase n=1 Tax=Sulfuriferula nivalis TaxID=2675298 RepID=A0A809SEE3_9PROT|nr:lipid-A-disaccharide synthase [Sulfuriferula nivalis]BBP01347.1 lipid-A-disaccharide synthase [Sulfuriferula nivalis]